MEVVIKMPYVVRVDRQGRLVLPIEIRRSLGVVQGGSIILREKNNRIFIDINGELEKKVDQWKEKLKNMNIEVKALELRESKWVSEDWMRRKLGIRA
jgi:bifunctional DNA-binding transcriptional regulator/antitoxin component of YhaV-PrlF toxin-antitoxin module